MQIEDAKRTAKRTFVILSLALAGCRGPIAPASPTPEVVSIRLLADTSTSPLLRELAAAYHPSKTLVAWDIRVAEGRSLLDMVRSAQAPYALVDYLPTESEDGTAAASLWATPLGQTGIGVVVHPTNQVDSLTAAQLRAILQGRILNWQSLGGPDLPLTVVARDDGSSTAAIIQTIVMGDRMTTRAARLALTDEAVVSLVAATPGAIGYVPMAYLTSGVRAVPLDGIALSTATLEANQYPIRSPLLFAGQHEPGDDAYRAFFAWVQSPEGQAIVRKHYGGLVGQ